MQSNGLLKQIKGIKKNQTHAKAVMEMMALDRKAGITTNMSDGLD